MQCSGECDTSHLIAADISRHRQMGTPIYFKGFVQKLQRLLLCCCVFAWLLVLASLEAFQVEYYWIFSLDGVVQVIGSPEPSVIQAAKAQVSASVCLCMCVCDSLSLLSVCLCMCVCVSLSLSCLSLCVPLSLYLLLPLSFSLSLSFSPPPPPPPFHFFFFFSGGGGGGAWGEIICPQRCFVVSFLGQDYYLLVPGTAAVSDAHPFSFYN